MLFLYLSGMDGTTVKTIFKRLIDVNENIIARFKRFTKNLNNVVKNLYNFYTFK